MKKWKVISAIAGAVVFAGGIAAAVATVLKWKSGKKEITLEKETIFKETTEDEPAEKPEGDAGDKKSEETKGDPDKEE